MATGSFKHNIIIKDKRDAKALIDALENANKTKKKQKKRYKVR